MKKITVLEKETEQKTAANVVLESFNKELGTLREKYIAYAKDNLSEAAAEEVEKELR